MEIRSSMQLSELKKCRIPFRPVRVEIQLAGFVIAVSARLQFIAGKTHVYTVEINMITVDLALVESGSLLTN